MKQILLLLTLGLAPFTAKAQTSAPPAPDGPLPARLPESAAWTITFIYEDEAAARVAQTARYDRVKTLTVTKTGETYLEQTVRHSGNTEEKWIYNGIQFKSSPNSNSILLISPPSGEGDVNPEWSDYSKGEFPELRWLNADNYTGADKWQKKKAHLFVNGAKRAWLDLDTKLPLANTNGQITMSYTYHAAPEDPLIPPQKYLDILAKYRRGLEALNFQPSRPASDGSKKRTKITTSTGGGQN